jgi:hypothetical protein
MYEENLTTKIVNFNTEIIASFKKEISNSNSEIVNFEALVDKMAQSELPVFHYNAWPYQTRKVVNTIIEIASKNSFLKIFLGDINCEFFGIDIIKKLQSLKETTCKTNIILAEKPNNNMWKELVGKNINVYYKEQYDKTLNHVCFTNTAYRIEAPHPRLGVNEEVTSYKPLRPARFGFNLPEHIKILNILWDSVILKNSIPLA